MGAPIVETARGSGVPKLNTPRLAISMSRATTQFVRGTSNIARRRINVAGAASNVAGGRTNIARTAIHITRSGSNIAPRGIHIARPRMNTSRRLINITGWGEQYCPAGDQHRSLADAYCSCGAWCRPTGTTDNSPATYPLGKRVQDPKSPGGAKESAMQCQRFLSSLTGLVLLPPGNPALKRWAIAFRPPGCGKATPS